MLSPILTGLLCGSTAIMITVALWAWYCVYRTNKDWDVYRDKKSDYFKIKRHPDHYTHYHWACDEGDSIDHGEHCLRRFTFRNPWLLYGPITISLVKDYPMDETFWEWYKYAYKGYISAHDRDYIIKHMAKDIMWSRSTINPMVYMFMHHWELDLNDFRPKPKGPVMLEGAAEYDEIMRMQEAVGGL